MIPIRAVVRWSVASNEQAIRNARAAATECSQRRVERAEVERFLHERAQYNAETSARTAATGG